MSKNIMISMRIGQEERDWISIIKRYDSEFNVSNFFRASLLGKFNELKDKVGANTVGFFQIVNERDIQKQKSETKTELKQEQGGVGEAKITG